MQIHNVQQKIVFIHIRHISTTFGQLQRAYFVGKAAAREVLKALYYLSQLN